MQSADRDSKPGVGARNITPITPITDRIIDMARLPTGEYRAVMADLFVAENQHAVAGVGHATD